jgi:hypothetical protein
MLLADGPSLAAELNGLGTEEVGHLKKANSEVTVVLLFFRFIIIVFGFSVFLAEAVFFCLLAFVVVLVFQHFTLFLV